MEQIIGLIDKLNSRIKKLEEWASIVMVVVIVVATGVGVYWRYALRMPLGWPNGLAMFLLLWISFLGASLVEREDGHYKIEFIYDKFPDKLKVIIDIATTVLKIVFLVLFVYVSIAVFPRQARRAMAGELQIHKGWHTFSLTVGFSFLALTNLVRLLRSIVSLTSSQKENGSRHG